jgi:hypothetical protein
MPSNSFDQALEAVDVLPVDEQLELVDIVRRRLSERGRRRIVAEVNEAESEFDRGLARPTGVDALLTEIES